MAADRYCRTSCVICSYQGVLSPVHPRPCTSIPTFPPKSKVTMSCESTRSQTRTITPTHIPTNTYIPNNRCRESAQQNDYQGDNYIPPHTSCGLATKSMDHRSSVIWRLLEKRIKEVPSGSSHNIRKESQAGVKGGKQQTAIAVVLPSFHFCPGFLQVSC